MSKYLNVTKYQNILQYPRMPNIPNIKIYFNIFKCIRIHIYIYIYTGDICMSKCVPTYPNISQYSYYIPLLPKRTRWVGTRGRANSIRGTRKSPRELKRGFGVAGLLREYCGQTLLSGPAFWKKGSRASVRHVPRDLYPRRIIPIPEYIRIS